MSYDATYAGASSEEIREQIDKTLGKMDATIDSIEERFRPRHLINDLLSTADTLDKYNDRKGTTFVVSASKLSWDAARRHPLPTILMGSGLAWLILEELDRYRRVLPEPLYEHSGSLVDARTGKPYDENYEKEWKKMSGAEDLKENSGSFVDARTGEPYDDTYGQEYKQEGWKVKVSHFADQAKQRISSAASSASHSVQGTSAKQVVTDHPLALGVACAAFGVLAGMLLPRSKPEDQWMGATSDRLKHQARNEAERFGREAKHRAEEVAEHTLDTAKHELERQGLTPEQLKAKAEQVATETAESARQEAREQKNQMAHSHK